MLIYSKEMKLGKELKSVNNEIYMCNNSLKDNIEINVIISGIKQLGMALEREMPNEWNRFINACSIIKM